MQKSRAVTPNPERDVYEWLVGGDGDEFTIVCHPQTAQATPGKDIRQTPGRDLICKLSEIKDRPVK